MCFVRWMKDWMKLAAVAAVLAGFSMLATSPEAEAQSGGNIPTLDTVRVTATPPVDRSKGYFGGATPRYVEPPAQRQMVDIASVGGRVNVDAILGCSGLDIGAAIENTLNVGNLADEFTSYLKTSLAQSALTLLYQSPSLNAVLDGLRAVGHARVSMGQAQCSATEAFVDSRSAEVRKQAQDLCHAREKGNPQCSTPEKLASYIREILGVDKDGNRLAGAGGSWNGCLYDHICEDGQNCAWSGFVPNFCYDVGTGEGKTAEPMLSPQEAFDGAEHAADTIMGERVNTARAVVDACGYTDALQALEVASARNRNQNTSQEMPECARNIDMSDVGAGGDQTAGGAADSLAAYDEYFGANSCVDPETGAVFADVKRLLDQASGTVENADGTSSNAVTGATNLDFAGLQKIIEGTVKCNLGKKIHPHVDVKITLLPEAQQEAMQKSISQAIAAESTMSVFNAVIFKLSELLATKGFSSDGGMNSAVRDQVVLLIDQMKNMRDAMRTTLDSYRDVSERVAAMNEYVDQSSERAASGAAARTSSRLGTTDSRATSSYGRALSRGN